MIEEPGWLQPMESQRVRHKLATKHTPKQDTAAGGPYPGSLL